MNCQNVPKTFQLLVMRYAVDVLFRTITLFERKDKNKYKEADKELNLRLTTMLIANNLNKAEIKTLIWRDPITLMESGVVYTYYVYILFNITQSRFTQTDINVHLYSIVSPMFPHNFSLHFSI